MNIFIVYSFVVAALLAVSGAYVTSPGAVPVNRRQQWLREMTTDICQSPPGELTGDMLARAPDLMHAWSHSQKGGKEPALAVESLLVRILEERRSGNSQAVATTDDYNCLLEGWARSKSGLAGAERCEQILTEMEDRHRQGDETLHPNLQSFKAVLMAWKLSGAKFAAIRAQRILEWMIRLASDGENDQVLPDADSFDIVLQLWSKSPELHGAAQKTENLLTAMERLYLSTQMESVRPRTSTYNAVLSAWCKSNEPGALERANGILQFMEARSLQGDESGAPNEASYTTVVSALLKNRGPRSAQMADDILRRAETLLPTNPDTILYNTAIACWARSNRSKAYRKARSILDRQISNYESGIERCKPDVFSFTSVIGSCAMEPGGLDERTKAFSVALGAYQQLVRYDKPNHVTFGTMLKACARLLPENDNLRHKWAKKIFRQSVSAGCVGDMVVSRMREAVSPPIYRDLMQGYTRSNLPDEWVANVDEKSEHRKQLGPKKSRQAEV